MEDLRQKYNPDGSTLRKAQLRMLDILIAVDEIFRRNQIDYWLHGGTLLGAVRHKGFIPWDDDMDIAVRYSDLPRIRKILQAELPERYCYQDYTTDPYFYLFIGKVRDKYSLFDESDSHKLKERGIYIDIIPMEEIISKKKQYPINFVYRHCLWGRCHYSEKMVDKLLGYVAYYPIKLLIWFMRLRTKLFHTHLWGDAYGWAFTIEEKESDIFPVTNIEFEGHIFQSPANPDGFLRTIYGDYMQIPPEEKRETHTKRIEFYD